MFLQRIIRAALCLIIMIALGCDHESDTLTEDSDTAGMEPSDDGIDQPLRGEVVINDTGMAAGQWGSDPYMIETGGDDTPVIEGDTLTITVSYGGGCEDHDFTLVASNVFAESYPVQLRGIVAHDAHGDRCRAYLTEDYDFRSRANQDAVSGSVPTGRGHHRSASPDRPRGSCHAHLHI